MAERLEAVGRKIGLKFMAAPVHGCYYLSTEMFYVEINIDASGAGSPTVNEAKIHHIDATQATQQANQGPNVSVESILLWSFESDVDPVVPSRPVPRGVNELKHCLYRTAPRSLRAYPRATFRRSCVIWRA